MGTMKDSNSIIDEDAVHVVDGILRGNDWNRSKPHPDRVGLDLLVDLLEDSHPQINFYIQIKGIGPQRRKGQPKPIVSKSGTINKPIELEHLAYYMKLPTPVFLVVVDVEKQVAYYTHIQRYVKENLAKDNWRGRLRKFQEDRTLHEAKEPPTKSIHVPVQNNLSEIEKFKQDVREAKGFMARLGIPEGIASRERELRQLDDRFDPRAVANRDGEYIEIIATKPVQLKMRGKMLKEKFDDIFGRGIPREITPSEVGVAGSPLLERIFADGGIFSVKREISLIASLIRTDASGKKIASLDYLECQMEGGFDETRISLRFPHDLFKLSLTLNLKATRNSLTTKTPVNINFAVSGSRKAWIGRPLCTLPFLDRLLPAFQTMDFSDSFSLALGSRDVGSLGVLPLINEVHDSLYQFGCSIEFLAKARSVCLYFDINPELPDEFPSSDLAQIDFLHGLIEGHQMPNPTPASEITIWMTEDNIAETLKVLDDHSDVPIKIVAEAEFPLLGTTVHIKTLESIFSTCRLLTNLADAPRRRNSETGDVRLSFAVNPQSDQFVKLVRDE